MPTYAEAAGLALYPLSGVVGGYFSAYWLSNRNIYINSITKERSQWIEKLRSNLAEFVSDLDNYAFSNLIMFGGSSGNTDYSIVSQATHMSYSRALDRLATILQLQLNLKGEIDGNLAILIQKASNNRDKPLPLIVRIETLIIGHSQWLLKAEWEKVKSEARGFWWHLAHMGEKAKYLNEYTRWKNAEGAFDRLIVELDSAQSVLAVNPA